MSLISSVYVPHDGPVGAKILVVGESPGGEEEIARKPFVGVSGQLLLEVLARYGIRREDVRLANLCNYRPSSNKFANLIGSPELKEGLEELRAYITANPPNVIAALGEFPLRYLAGVNGIDAWRGSIITSSLVGCETIKLIATRHPSAVLRDRKLYPLFDADIRRIVSDSDFPDLRHPEFEVTIVDSAVKAEEVTELLCNSKELGTDIESVKGTTQILCVGFAPSPSSSYVFPYEHWLLPFIQKVLESSASKIFHFGTYDRTVLQLNGLRTTNNQWDTLVAQHILNPELPRSLAFLCSVLTRFPYYKSDGRANIPSDQKAWSRKRDKTGLYIYNGQDCCATVACKLEQEKDFKDEPDLFNLFQQEMALIPAAISIGTNGMLIDPVRRIKLQHIILAKWARKQTALDALVGRKVNVRSPVLKDILYKQFNLPVRKKRDGAITTDEDAVVSLIGFTKQRLSELKRPDSIMEWRIKLAVLGAILEIRGLRQLLSNYILAKIHNDFRLRSTYKVAGPETGRWAAEHFVDGTGLNPQTFPRAHIEMSPEDEALLEKAGFLLQELNEDDQIHGDSVTEELEVTD